MYGTEALVVRGRARSRSGWGVPGTNNMENPCLDLVWALQATALALASSACYWKRGMLLPEPTEMCDIGLSRRSAVALI